MKKALAKNQELYYYVDGEKVIGVPDGLYGDVSGLTGCVDGISGCVDGITGNMDNCEITDADRKAGIDIASLIQ